MNPKYQNGFLALSYHYIRSPEAVRDFPRILGNRLNDFVDHIKNLSRTYNIISPEAVESFYYSPKNDQDNSKTGLLLTFDDGLSDHYLVAKILHDLGIKAFFFIPTCIIADELPANPNIIHYCLAKYGIAKFLDSFSEAITKFKIKAKIPAYKKGDDVWKAIAEIKRTIHYNLSNTDSRRILLHIYENTLHHDYKNALEIIHLTRPQIQEIISMGHTLGSHTHTHFSAANSSNSDLKHELDISKSILDRTFDLKTNAFSYTFGLPADCLKAEDLLKLTGDYDLAFTIEPKLNTKTTSPLELGRYMPSNKDTTVSILKKLVEIQKDTA